MTPSKNELINKINPIHLFTIASKNYFNLLCLYENKPKY